jgi:hypothetical protein
MHLMKTLLINKLAAAFKDNVLPQEHDTLKTGTNTARAMWKQKNLARHAMLRIQNLTMSHITSFIEYPLNK